MIFDFDKTLHQVKKTGRSDTPRILLKLHFIVCENGYFPHTYMNFVSKFYVLYYYIARYTEQIGTDPTTYTGFFWGLMWEYPFYPTFKYWVILLYLQSIYKIKTVYNVPFIQDNIPKIILYSHMDIMFMYLLIVGFYWMRYTLFAIK